VATRETRPDRVRQFSDGVFAVLITILVLELRPPKAASFSALWPTGLTYLVSYVFSAIIWVSCAASPPMAGGGDGADLFMPCRLSQTGRPRDERRCRRGLVGRLR
jgi:hypothetical protein